MIEPEESRAGAGWRHLSSDPMKVAIAGKGGVGKTTLAAAFARRRARDGHPVIAVDADPDGNLPAALGVPPDRIPLPIAGMRDLVRERAGEANVPIINRMPLLRYIFREWTQFDSRQSLVILVTAEIVPDVFEE